MMKPSKGFNGDLNQEHKTIANSITMGTTREIDKSGTNILKYTEQIALFSLKADSPGNTVVQLKREPNLSFMLISASSSIEFSWLTLSFYRSDNPF